MAGWIKLRKDIKDTWLWKDPVKLSWYISLLMLADNDDGVVDLSMNALAKKWGVTAKEVSRFLHRLDEDDLVVLVDGKNFKLSQQVSQIASQVYIRKINENLKQLSQRVSQQVSQLRKEQEENKESTKENKEEIENNIKDKERLLYAINNKLFITTNNLEKKEILQEKSERYVGFLDWVKKNAPWCNTYLKPISEIQFYKLISQYSSEQVADIILKIENYSKRTSYKDLYLTANDWLKRNGTLQQGH